MLFNKLFGKKKYNTRISSRAMEEEAIIGPIPFRTIYGGSKPLSYHETSEIKAAQEEPLKLLQQVIDQGMIDHYSNPAMFYDIVENYYKIARNSIEHESIIFEDVIESIQMVAKEGLLKGKREAFMFQEKMMQLPRDLKHEKGHGEHYDEIKEK